MRKTLLTLFTIVFIYSQNTTAQTLKTYSGNFGDGNATYTYYTNDYGDAILQGDFAYTQSLEVSQASVNVKISGSFSKGKRNGKWTFESIGKGSYYKNIMGTNAKYNMDVTQNYVINYLNGKLHGEFYHRAIQKDFVPDLGQYGYINSDITSRFSFVNGVINGKFTIIDKDKDEPMNLDGNVVNEYFDGTISNNGKEIIFSNGIMIKNQNWSKQEQDALVLLLNKFKQYQDTTYEIQKENGLEKIKDCDGGVSYWTDKYVSKFFQNTDWQHKAIGGDDDSYLSSGCYYYIKDLNSLPDFKTSQYWKELNKFISDEDVLGFLRKYKDIKSSLKDYKPSSLIDVNEAYDKMLKKLPQTLEYQKKLISLQKELLKRREEFPLFIQSNKLNLDNKVQSYFLPFPGKKVLSSITNQIKEDKLYSPSQKIFILWTTDFYDPSTNEKYSVMSKEEENKLNNYAKLFDEAEVFTQLIYDEELLATKIIELLERDKSSNAYYVGSHLFHSLQNAIGDYNYPGNGYILNVQEINTFYNTAIDLFDLFASIDSIKLKLTHSVSSTNKIIEKTMMQYLTNDIREIEIKINTFQKDSSICSFLEYYDQKAYTQKTKITLNQQNLESKKEEFQNHVNILTLQNNQLFQMIRSLNEFDSSKNQVLAIEFIDKTLAKTIKTLINSKAQNLEDKLTQNSKLVVNKETYQLILNDINTEVNYQKKLFINLLKLQSRELSKEEISVLKKLKDNEEELIKTLFSL